jgi:hypothetical protein
MTAINVAISELPVTPDFIRRAKMLGLETLSDILDADFPLLKRKRDFSYLWYADLLNLLKELDLLDQFQDGLS